MKKILSIFFTVLMTSLCVNAQVMKIYKGSTLVDTYPISQANRVRFKSEVVKYEYVDLGLPSGLKWATMNIGANTPEDYGDYFAWGETEPYYEDGHSQDIWSWNWKTGKTGYNWESYNWCQRYAFCLTKYNSNPNFGTVDYKQTLELADDIAHVKWGGSWRMPTTEEQDELLSKCTWTWTCQNGVLGYKITGSNGKSIFFPAAGYRLNDDLHGVSSDGRYWSSSLDAKYSKPYCAYILSFASSTIRYESNDRIFGLPIRAVCP